jgi:hypothetical protein
VQLTGNLFVAEVRRQLEQHQTVMVTHTQRNNVYAELEFILKYLDRPYLAQRYNRKDVQAELEYFQKQGLPRTEPLFLGYIFARRNTPQVNAAFAEWWQLLGKYGIDDQSKLTYVTWKHKLKRAILSSDVVIPAMAKRKQHREQQ